MRQRNWQFLSAALCCASAIFFSINYKSNDEYYCNLSECLFFCSFISLYNEKLFDNKNYLYIELQNDYRKFLICRPEGGNEDIKFLSDNDIFEE